MTNNKTVVSLMKMALALLDDRGEGATLTSCYLPAAIDVATGAQPVHPGELLDDERMFPLHQNIV